MQGEGSGETVGDSICTWRGKWNSTWAMAPLRQRQETDGGADSRSLLVCEGLGCEAEVLSRPGQRIWSLKVPGWALTLCQPSAQTVITSPPRELETLEYPFSVTEPCNSPLCLFGIQDPPGRALSIPGSLGLLHLLCLGSLAGKVPCLTMLFPVWFSRSSEQFCLWEVPGTEWVSWRVFTGFIQGRHVLVRCESVYTFSNPPSLGSWCVSMDTQKTNPAIVNEGP